MDQSTNAHAHNQWGGVLHTALHYRYFIRGIYLCALCESLPDRINICRTNIKLRTVFFSRKILSPAQYNVGHSRPRVRDRVEPASMSLFKYFKSPDSLPTAKDTGMSEAVMREVNEAISRVLTSTEPSTSRKRKVYSVFSDEQRATIGQYAAENGNAAAVKKFKQWFGREYSKAFQEALLDRVEKSDQQYKSLMMIPLITLHDC